MTSVLLRIGEFARIVQLPVRTVRYYGDIGLLPPSETDPQTGYRLYGLDRVERAGQLLTLKQIGLPLEEIGRILDDSLSPERFRSMLEGHIAALEQSRDRLDEQLVRARAQLTQLNQRLERPMADITIKTTEAKRIAYVRQQIDGTDKIAGTFEKLFEAVDPSVGTGPAANIYHHFSDDGTDIDIEAALPIPDDYEPHGDAHTRVVDPSEVASITHHGSFNTLHESYTELLAWIEANGYEVSGPAYEWNIVCTPPVRQDDDSYVTDIEFEVTAKG